MSETAMTTTFDVHPDMADVIAAKQASLLYWKLQQDGQYRAIPVPFPFNFRAVDVLVRFETVPVLSQGQLVRSSERPGWQN